MKRSYAVAAMIALFLLGTIAGALLTHALYVRQLKEPGGLVDISSRLFLRQLERRVELSDVQRERIQEIFAETNTEAREIRREIAPRVRSLSSRTLDRIRKVLTPDQARTFDLLRRRHEQRLQRFLPPPGPRRGPPGVGRPEISAPEKGSLEGG